MEENEIEDKVKKEIEKQNEKELRKILIVIGAVAIIFLVGFVMINSIRHFEYRGLDFNVVKESDLVFYNIAFPMYSVKTGSHVADYNIYLRNDPRDLDSIKLLGGMSLRDKMVVETQDEFKCDGDGVIAMANFVDSFRLIGTKVMKDSEVESCDEQGRFMYVTIKPGEKTEIEQIGSACYEIRVKDCEILEATEKFIVEAFAKFDKKIYVNEEE